MPSVRSLLLAASAAVYATSAIAEAAVPLAACQANYQCPTGQAACGAACYDYNTNPQYTCANSTLQAIANAWTDSGIVPYVVGAVPISQLQLSWNLSTPVCNTGSVLTIQPGSEAQQDQVLTLPTSVHWPANNGSLYTFVVFDPDAPTRSNATEAPYAHFAAVNVPVVNGTQYNLTAGNTVFPYAYPTPPQGSGYHRYIWLVFLQTNGTIAVPNYNPNNRTNFDWYGFVSGGYTNVSGVRTPNHYPQLVSGNFFYVQYEDQATSIAWRDAGIVPQILPANPPQALTLAYNTTTNGTAFTIYPGSAVNVSDVASFPSNVTWPASNSSYYSLIVFDPDVPSRVSPTNAPLIHYANVNIQGSNVTSGNLLYPYASPAPPQGVGYHRYTWLVYQQLNGYTNLTQQNITVNSSVRTNFNYTSLIYNVTGGDYQIVAGNFFVAENINQTAVSA